MGPSAGVVNSKLLLPVVLSLCHQGTPVPRVAGTILDNIWWHSLRSGAENDFTTWAE